MQRSVLAARLIRSSSTFDRLFLCHLWPALRPACSIQKGGPRDSFACTYGCGGSGFASGLFCVACNEDGSGLIMGDLLIVP